MDTGHPRLFPGARGALGGFFTHWCCIGLVRHCRHDSAALRFSKNWRQQEYRCRRCTNGAAVCQIVWAADGELDKAPGSFNDGSGSHRRNWRRLLFLALYSGIRVDMERLQPVAPGWPVG